MRIRGRRPSGLIAALLAAFALAGSLLAGSMLAGCASAPSPERSRTPAAPTPTPTPIFASDAQALAAATDAYRQFLRLSDDVGHDGGARPERVAEYAGDAVVEAERRQAHELADASARSYGRTRVSNSRLESVSNDGGSVTISMYACQDIRNVDVRDHTGSSLFSNDRPDFVAYRVRLSVDARGQLVVMSNKFWPGGGVCD